MTTLLALLSLTAVALLVATVSVFVHRIDAMLRSAAGSARLITEDTSSMRRNGAVISPGIEQINQNLYVVAVHLAQLGEAAERLPDVGRA